MAYLIERLQGQSDPDAVGGAAGGDIDSDLLAVIDAWAELQETAKADILAIVPRKHQSQKSPSNNLGI